MAGPSQRWPDLGALCPFACLGLTFGSNSDAVRRAYRRYARGLGSGPLSAPEVQALERISAAAEVCIIYQQDWTREQFSAEIVLRCKCARIHSLLTHTDNKHSPN